MGLFGRLFGSGTTLDKIQKAYSRQDWAEVVALAETFDSEAQESADASWVELVTAAGNQLARINLEQAEACLRAEDPERAREHLELVIKHGRDSELCQAARHLLEQCESEPDISLPATGHCASCDTGSTKTSDKSTVEDPMEIADFAEAWELTLAALPAHWAESYARLTPSLQQAVLLAHSGRDDEAKQIFLKQNQPESSDVTQYELAGLYLRNEDLESGLAILEELLQNHPQHDLALQLAIDLVFQQIPLPWLQHYLLQNLDLGIHAGLCHAGLAKLAAVAGDEEELVKHVKNALDNDYLDYDLLVWSARILEKRGLFDEAERMLQHLPGGRGCSGGSDPLLGEFWLRHGRNADQALDSFKSAARQDPENPRWALRIAQSYLLKGWKREADAMLTQIVRTPQLDEQLKKEAELALGKIRN